MTVDSFSNMKHGQDSPVNKLTCFWLTEPRWSLIKIISTKIPQQMRKKRRYECMQRFPDLFIVFYSWKEFGRAPSVSRNMLTVRKTLSLRDFPLIKTSKQYMLFIASNISTRVSSSMENKNEQLLKQKRSRTKIHKMTTKKMSPPPKECKY